MSLAPRAVVVHRRTELDELLARHGTLGQAEFFLATRGRSLGDRSLRDLVEQDAALRRALTAVSAAIPLDWRRGSVERADLSRFLFTPEDVVLVVGQDGLVANVAKYLAGQPVVGVTPGESGVLVRHPAEATADLLRSLDSVEPRTMVELTADDGQKLLALNEIYLGHPSHQTARYRLGPERQASSGLLVGTGTGATGWCRSVWQERHSPLRLPAADERRLVWFVREAWPSPTTATSLTEGELTTSALTIDVESDHLSAFGDGLENDAVTVTRGQSVTFAPAARAFHLVR
ncbi:hypothetical protein [Amycolatopsis sp. DSM 110486]|uniref:hypothetical protein n=1 Tax=Amycolatopsis sp. DSM 110486 TaxID=2865832 RepID=UPI001C6A7644|nr:hypothetical protein [Amycolatopsis sp. DSM 110486]QYN19558.1 hypothetical protein K1T34_44300 [Amycolatopsis sp. DSM 110486]